MSTKTRFVVIVLAVACRHSLSRPQEVGVYPQFVSEQDDIVVYETNAIGTKSNLLLVCNVMGIPQPTVKWYRGDVDLETEFVMTDGSLLIPNITDGECASIPGVIYHCEATNFIGKANFSATIRSKDINVTYAFFNGFSSTDSRSIVVPVANEIDIALECDVLDANPPPAIQWRRNSSVLAEKTSRNLVRYLDGGRFLYIRNIVDFSETFQCSVTNALIHQTMTSTTTYTLNGTGLQDQETYIYKEIGNLTSMVGDVGFEFSYVASEGLKDVSCDFFIGEIELRKKAAVGTIRVVALPTSGTMAPLSCRDGNTVISTGLLTVFDRAAITSPPVSNREAIVDESNITFSCPHTGTPSPILSWYHNGQIVTGFNSVMIQNDSLFIASPQTSDSGVYQCFVENSVSKVMVSWLLEVREPERPQIVPFNLIQLNATEDRRVGILIVRETGSVVELAVYVHAHPCPDSFQWSFNGTSISNGADYLLSTDPCSDQLEIDPFRYTLTINSLTVDTSGPYSVTFTNLAGQDSLSPTYITVPVPAEISELSLTVVGDPSASCLLNKSTIVLTCQTEGFPRPNVVFRRGQAVITPGVYGFTKVSSSFSDQISLVNVTHAMAGNYICADTTSQIISGSETFAFCTKADILESKFTFNPLVGDEVNIQCKVGGIPAPEVTWTKDGTTLVDNSPSLRIVVTMGNTSIVEIQKADESTSGQYICTATNLAGSVTQMFNVTVRGLSHSSTNIILLLIILIVTVPLILILCISIVVVIVIICYMFRRGTGQPSSTEMRSMEPIYDELGPTYEEPLGPTYEELLRPTNEELLEPTYEEPLGAIYEKPLDLKQDPITITLRGTWAMGT